MTSIDVAHSRKLGTTNPPTVNQLWHADLALVRTATDTFYMGTIIDECSGDLLSYSLGREFDDASALALVSSAIIIAAPPVGCSFYTDNRQFPVDLLLIDLLHKHGFTISLGNHSDTLTVVLSTYLCIDDVISNLPDALAKVRAMKLICSKGT